MPQRIVKAPVILHRDGKQVAPEVGSTFDFTDSELAEINKLQPDALDFILTSDEVQKGTTVNPGKAK